MRRAWFLVTVISVAALAGADGPARKYELITPKPKDIIASGINDRGDIVGFEWVEEKERPGVVEQVPFFARGKEMTYLPKLAGYTATFPEAVSDAGLVVGRASKPAPPGVRIFLRNQAFIWDAKNGIRGLGALPDDWASFASGVTRDGQRISGYSVGDNRMRACVWDRQGETWKGTVLPHETGLRSNTVAMSGNGRHVSAVDGLFPCLWSQSKSGEWTREVIGEAGSLVPRAVNDSGTVVGLRYAPDGLPHAAVWTRSDGPKALPEPKGYVRSEALAVNNAGAVVGMVDGPGGSPIGPNAFVYEGGKLRFLDEGGALFASATAINNKGQVAGVLEEKEEAPPPKP